MAEPQIDASKVQWDDPPKIDPAKVKGDERPSKYDPSVSTGRYLASRAAGGFGGLAAIPAQASELARSQPFASPVISLLSQFTPNVSGETVKNTVGGLLGYDPQMKAPSEGAQIAGGVAEFFGSGILPSVGVVKSAVHKAPAIASEIGATVFGGAGQELGGPLGGLVGSIMGANAPLAVSKASGMLGGAIPWLRNEVSAQAPREISNAIAANPSSAQNTALAGQVAQDLSQIGGQGFRPTLAQVTGAPGVIAREAQIAGSSVDDLARYVERQTQNQQALRRATDTAFPQGGDITRSADRLARRTTAQLEAKLDSINAQRENLSQVVGSRPQQEIGQRLNQLRDEAQNAARQIRDAKYADVYASADKAGIKENMNDVGDLVRGIVEADKNTFQSMPPVFSQIMKEYPSSTFAKEVSFRELHSLYKRVNSEMGAYARAGDVAQMRHLGQVKDALNAKLNKYLDAPDWNPALKETADKFRDANKFFSEKYAPAFYEGVGGRMVATNRYGDILKPEDVVGKFFTPSGVDDFNLIYGSNPQAQKELADGVLGLFRQAAVRDGKIDPKAAENFIRNNQETLDKMADIKTVLSNTKESNKALVDQANRLSEKMYEFDKSVVSRIAKTDDVDKFIDTAIKDRRTMFNLIGMARDDATRKSVARAIVDRLPVVAAKEGLDPLTFVANNERLLRPALDRLGKNHFNNLKTIAAAQTVLGRTITPSSVGAPKVEDFIERVTGSTPRTIWAQSVNTAAGRQSPVSAFLHLGSKLGIKVREDNVNALMREAIYNPEVAAGFAKAAKGQKFTVGESNSLKNHLAAAGIRIASSEDE